MTKLNLGTDPGVGTSHAHLGQVLEAHEDARALGAVPISAWPVLNSAPNFWL